MSRKAVLAYPHAASERTNEPATNRAVGGRGGLQDAPVVEEDARASERLCRDRLDEAGGPARRTAVGEVVLPDVAAVGGDRPRLQGGGEPRGLVAPPRPCVRVQSAEVREGVKLKTARSKEPKTIPSRPSMSVGAGGSGCASR